MGRWIGIDYGSRRIGVAIANPSETIASPAVTLDSAGTAHGDADRVLHWATENEADGIVVGLPLNMDGSDSTQTGIARRFADVLRKRGALPVELWDERLSSYQADQFLDAGQIRQSRRQRLRDALAAQVILQSFLDARASGTAAPEDAPTAED